MPTIEEAPPDADTLVDYLGALDPAVVDKASLPLPTPLTLLLYGGALLPYGSPPSSNAAIADAAPTTAAAAAGAPPSSNHVLRDAATRAAPQIRSALTHRRVVVQALDAVLGLTGSSDGVVSQCVCCRVRIHCIWTAFG